MKIRLFLATLVCSASVHAAPTAWLDGTLLEDCEYCRTDAFHVERKSIANQVGHRSDLASAMGYIVTMREGSLFACGAEQRWWEPAT